MQVTVRRDNVDKALSIFKRKHNEKMLEVRKRQYYEMTSALRSRRRRIAALSEQKRQRDNNIRPA